MTYRIWVYLCKGHTSPFATTAGRDINRLSSALVESFCNRQDDMTPRHQTLNECDPGVRHAILEFKNRTNYESGSVHVRS